MNEIEINEDNCVLSDDEMCEIALALGYRIGSIYASGCPEKTVGFARRHQKIIAKLVELNDLAKQAKEKKE